MSHVDHMELASDHAVMLALRADLASAPRLTLDPEDRPAFDALTDRTPHATGVQYAPDVIGGVAGWWCRPPRKRSNTVILYFHGGAYVLGSASAYRHLVGQIARRSGMAAFVADYALAPENPYPAAVNDGLSACQGLAARGCTRMVLAGDSAGGGLALALLAEVSARKDAHRPVGATVIAPWTDLTLASPSLISRQDRDPLLSKDALAHAVRLYMRQTDPREARASPLYGPLGDLPPVQIHVGRDDVLLDDSQRYASSLHALGGSVDLHVWDGMPHVFPAFVGSLTAASEALDIMAASLVNMDKGR